MNNSLLANKYLLILLIFILLFCTYFLLNPFTKITQFTAAGAALASGVDVDTKKLVVVDTDTSQLVAPCKPIGDVDKYPTDKGKYLAEAKGSYKNIPDCAVQILTDSNQALSAALEISKKPIEGKIKKNGETKPATFVVTVTAVYRGSNCNTTSSGGNQHENCGNHR